MPTHPPSQVSLLPVPLAPWAKRLGYGGLMPFLGLGLAAWVLQGSRQAQAVLRGASGGLWLWAAGLWACWAVDRSVYPRLGLHGWLAMRLNLTIVASLMCAAAALVTVR